MISVKNLLIVLNRFREEHFFSLLPSNLRMAAVEEGKESQTGTVNSGYANDEPRRKLSPPLSTLSLPDDRQRKISSGSQGYIRRSQLHNGDRPHHVESGNFRHSQQQHLDHLYNNATKTADEDASWWFLMCVKCRQKESGPGWEPSYWQNVCPYPFCPTYRHMARCFCLFLVVILAWGVVYSVVGEVAAPGGQLFDIAVLVISAHFGGYVFRVCNLPGLVGMLLVGVIFQNTSLINVHGPYLSLCGILRKIALVIILTRAGLDLDPGAMKKLFVAILKIGLIPWIVEAGFVTLVTYYFLKLPMVWGLLTGSIVAAVSPAVIVPGLMRLRGKGYGVAKGIPTIVIAISGIDDATSVAAYGIIQSIMFSDHSLVYNIVLGPGSLLLGVGAGCLWGLLSKYVPEKGDPFVVPMRILMLLGGGMIAVFGSEAVNLEGAGPLAVVAAAFISAWLWSTQGWDIEDNAAATAFEIFWMIFEPILFSLTGTQIRLDEIDPHVFTIAFTGLLVAFILRICVTILVSIGSSLNMKEKCFIALSCMSKASVQAALAPVALDTVLKLGRGDTADKDYADIVLMVCVLSIVMTAPTGAIVIYFSGPRLLEKTVPGLPQHWRHGHRPSLRDITVIDEGNERDDLQRRMSRGSIARTPRHSTITPPNLT